MTRRVFTSEDRCQPSEKNNDGLNYRLVLPIYSAVGTVIIRTGRWQLLVSVGTSAETMADSQGVRN